MQKAIRIALLLFLLYQTAHSQRSSYTFYPAILPGFYTNHKLDITNYNPLIIAMMPVTNGKFYGEVRYNYDFNNTLGLYGGKTFHLGKNVNHLITPQIGVLKGGFTGISSQLYYQILSKTWEVNYQNQYSIQSGRRNFYFNWSDVQFYVCKKIRVGGTVQIYRGYDQNYFDQGLVVGYRTDKMFIVVFDFNPYDQQRHYFFLGFQYIITKTNKNL